MAPYKMLCFPFGAHTFAAIRPKHHSTLIMKWFILFLGCFSLTMAQKIGPMRDDPGSNFLKELIVGSPSRIDDDSVETSTETIGILNNDVSLSPLTRSCFKAVPLRYREKCLVDAVEKFTNSGYPMKRQCCTKWHQIDCIEKYVFNSIYCNTHQQLAVSRYFKSITSLDDGGSPECSLYRPVKEEMALWSSQLGRVAKCDSSTQ